VGTHIVGMLPCLVITTEPYSYSVQSGWRPFYKQTTIDAVMVDFSYIAHLRASQFIIYSVFSKKRLLWCQCFTVGDHACIILTMFYHLLVFEINSYLAARQATVLYESKKVTLVKVYQQFNWLVPVWGPPRCEIQFLNTASWLCVLWPESRPDLTWKKGTGWCHQR